MNWLTFVVASWLCFGLELGLKRTLGIGTGSFSPSFVVPLAVFVAINAPPTIATWAALALGVMVDLTATVPGSSPGSPPVIGPYALGYILMAQLVIALRGTMIRQNPLTLWFLTLVGAAVMSVAVVFLYTARSWFGQIPEWDASASLIQRMGGALYTSGVGLVMALVLIPAAPLFRFQNDLRRFGRPR